jgi:suppressor of G2 allele of SKP1
LEYEESKLLLEPLKGEIDAEASSYTVGKVKIEIRMQKVVPGRWAVLVKAPDAEGEHSYIHLTNS